MGVGVWVGVMEVGEVSAGRGVGGEVYTLRSGGSEEERPKLPSPIEDPPRELLGSIWPWTLRTPANIGAAPEERERKKLVRDSRKD